MNVVGLYMNVCSLNVTGVTDRGLAATTPVDGPERLGGDTTWTGESCGLSDILHMTGRFQSSSSLN
jgi:hypothetical protein